MLSPALAYLTNTTMDISVLAPIISSATESCNSAGTVGKAQNNNATAMSYHGKKAADEDEGEGSNATGSNRKTASASLPSPITYYDASTIKSDSSVKTEHNNTNMNNSDHHDILKQEDDCCYTATTPIKVKEEQMGQFDVSTPESANDSLSFDDIDDGNILNILQYASPAASANFGMTCRKRREKILETAALANDAESNVGSSLGQPLWKSFAVDRWGHGILNSTTVNTNEDNNTSWLQYYRHRCSSWKLEPVQISPLDLIQEQFAHDPYCLLTACILCSRTSGGPVIRKVVHDFLTKYPTPTDVVNADINIMANELHPLGLNRERVMKRFAVDFLNQDWTGNVIGLHGCGAFAAASFAVFCRGEYSKVLRDKKADRNVKAYAAFVKKSLCIHENKVGSVDNLQEKGREEARGEQTRRKRTAPRERSVLPMRRSIRKKTSLTKLRRHC